MLILGLCTVFGGLAVPSEGMATTCIPAMSHRDAAYFGVRAFRTIRPVGRPARALVPPCTAPWEPPRAPTPLAVFRIAGVHPAVAVTDQMGTVWLAWGFFPWLSSHPLYEAIKAGPRNYDATEGADCSRITASGRVTRPPRAWAGLEIAPDAPSKSLDPHHYGILYLRVDPHTRVVNLRRLGLPFVGRGRRVTITALRCPEEGGADDPPLLVARRIQPFAP